jgi:hypothetical protein
MRRKPGMTPRANHAIALFRQLLFTVLGTMKRS